MIRKAPTSRGFFDRWFGAFFIFSPFLNFIWAAHLKKIPDWWTFTQLTGLTQSISAFYWFMALGTVFSGILIVTRGAWLGCLAILGFNLVNTYVELPQNLELNHDNAIIALVANVLAFSFVLILKIILPAYKSASLSALSAQNSKNPVLEQSRTHEKISEPTRQSATRLPQKRRHPKIPTKRVLAKPLVISFAGIGVWAQVTHLSDQGVGVRRLGPHAPAGLEGRPIEITLAENLTFQVACQKVADDRYFFRFTNTQPENLRRLRSWAGRWSARQHSV